MPDQRSCAKHTPGPWWYTEICGHTVYAGSISAPTIIHDRAREIDSNPEVEANARLIAAAPELLAALKAIRQSLIDSANPYGYPGYPLEQVESALAKAEGPDA